MKPLRTALLLFGLPALGAAAAPAAFVYERTAILHGEWWRLCTGHWVHFSASHAAWNLLVLLLSGTWLERLRPGVLLRYTLLTAPLLGLGLLAFAPTMTTYGGLSGMAVGAVVLLGLTLLDAAPAGRLWWLVALALVAGKIAWEAATSEAIFSRFASGAISPSVESHLLGAVLGLATFVSVRWRTLRAARAKSASPREGNPSAAR